MPETVPDIRGSSGIGNGRMYRFDSLPSTNTWAMQHLDSLVHGDVVIVDVQTAGRGRRNRSWMSESGDGLTFSLIIDYPQKSDRIGLTGIAAALGVADCLSSTGLDPRLKWPNDVMLAGRKVCGILCESRSGVKKAVIGVGMNVNQSAAALERMVLEHPATSLLAETGTARDPRSMLALLLPCIHKAVTLLYEGDSHRLPERWRQYDWLTSCRVSVTDGSDTVIGAYLGVDEQGRLLLQTADGGEQRYWTGDVNRIRKCGEENNPAARPGTRIGRQ